MLNTAKVVLGSLINQHQACTDSGEPWLESASASTTLVKQTGDVLTSFPISLCADVCCRDISNKVRVLESLRFPPISIETHLEDPRGKLHKIDDGSRKVRDAHHGLLG